MAVTFIGSSAQTSEGDDSGTTVTVNFPSHLAGDLLVAWISTSDADEEPSMRINPESGWTEIVDVDVPAGDTPVSIYVAWHIATSDDEILSNVFNSEDSTGYVATGLVYRGVDQTTPIDVQALGSSQGASLSNTTPSVTTTLPNVFVNRIIAIDDNLAVGTTPSPSGYALRKTIQASAPGNGVTGLLYDMVEPSAGATGTEVISWTVDSEQNRSFVFGLRPAIIVEEFTVDAILQAFDQEKTFLVDARVGVRIHEFTVDGLPQATQTKVFTVDSILRATQTKTFTIDSILVRFKKFTINAVLKALGDNGNAGSFVQSGTINPHFTGTTFDVTIEAVVLANSFLIFQYRVDSADVDEVNVRGQLTSPTNIHFERTTGGASVELSWYVIQSPFFISSQRGGLTMATTTENQTITSVDLTKSFSLASWENAGASWGDGDTIRHRLTSATNLEFLIDTLPAGFEPTIDWEVVEFTNAVVQRGITTFASLTTSEDIPITSVDLSRSIVHLSNTINGDIAIPPDDHGLTGELTSSTNLHIERVGTGHSMQIAWEIIEFPVSVNVQSGLESLGTTQTVANIPISSVDLSRTAVLISHDMKGGRTNDAVADNPHTIWYEAELSSATNLRLTRGASDTSTGDVAWYVIEFAPAQQAIAVVDAQLVRHKQFTVDAKLRGRKDFTIDAILGMVRVFTINALVKAFGDNGNCGARIQTDVATLAIGQTSLSVTIDPVVMGGSFLVFNQNEAGTDTNQFNVFGEITNSTTLTFTRKANAGTDIEVSICWYVVEYTESISVQRGTNAMATTTVNQTITAVDILKSFPIQSFQNDGILWGADDAVRARLTTSTNLEFLSTLAITDNLAWQVIEYTGASVQRGLVTFADGGLTSTDIAITAVDRNRSFAIVTASKSATSTPANAGLTAELTTDTNLHIERASNSGNAQEIAWFVIELPANVTVQFGTETLGTTQTVANIAINPIKQGNTISFLSHNFKGGRGGEAVDQDPSTIWYTSELTSSTNLRLTRGLSSDSTSDVSWFVVEFGPLQQSCAFVDARLSPLEEFEVDALLQATFDKTFLVDAILQATFDKTFEVDACLSKTFDKDFLINALLQATQTETFLVDAFLQETQTETFAVDAILQATFTFDFTVDAFLQATQTFDFTVDAFLQATQTETFDVDAILKATFTETFLVDAFIKALNTNFNFLVDGFIQAENQKMFLVNGIAQATFDKDFTVDARLIVRNTETFLVDGRLIVRRTHTFLVDGLIQTQNIDKTFTIDGVLQATFTQDFTIDGCIRETFDKDFTVDAFVRATQTFDFTVDAFIQQQDNDKDFLIDGLPQATFTQDFTVDSILIATFDKDFTVSAFPRATIDKDFLVDAFIQILNQEKDFTVDTILVDQPTETFLVGAFLQATQTFNFLVDAFIEEEQMKMFIVDGRLRATIDKDFLVDGLLKGFNQEKDFTVDAKLEAVNDEDFLVDGLVQELNQEKDFLVDGLLEALQTEDFLVDAKVLKTQTKTFLVDAQLTKENQETTLVDSILSKTQTKDFTIDSRLLKVNTKDFTVDGKLAVRKNFQIDAKLTRQTTTDIDSILKAINDKDFLIDSILKEGNQQFFLIDALLVVVNDTTFTVDAQLAEQKTKDFTIDAFLQELNQEKDFLVDATLAEQKTTTFTVNSILIETQTEEFTIDSMLRLSQTKTFTISSCLMAINTETFTVDAKCKIFGVTKTFTVDTFVEQPINTKDFTVDAFIKEFNQEVTFIVDTFVELPTINKTFLVDSLIINVIPTTFTKDFTVNGVLQAFGQTETFVLRAIVFKVPSKIIDIGALLQATQTKTFTVDAKLVNVNAETFDIDAQLIVIAVNTKDFTVQAKLKTQDINFNFIVDGLVNIAPKETFTVNAELKALDEERDFQIDAHIRLIATQDFTTDAQLVAGIPETTIFTVDAIVGFFVELTVDAFLRAVNTKDFTVDAKLSTPKKFTINALIKRLGDNCALGEIFEDNILTNTGWVVVNGLGIQIRVDGANFPNEIEYDKLGDFFPGRLNKEIDQGQGGTVQVDSFADIRLDFKYKHLGSQLGNGSGGMIMGITDVGSRIMNQKRFGVRTRLSGGQFQVRLQMFDGTTLAETDWLNIALNQTVFLTAIKSGSNISLEMFSDAGRTVHTGASPTTPVDVSTLNQVIFDHMGGSGNDVVAGGITISGLLDDISLSTRICTDFLIDGNISGGSIKTFRVDAKLVRKAGFTLSAFIKAIGDVRCQPSFAEKIFEDDLNDTSNWSVEINNTSVDGWGVQRIFIDGESPTSEELDMFGDINGFIRMALPPGGFIVEPIFKTKYRRKFLASEGGLGITQGQSFRIEFELHQISKGDGVWLALNKNGFHPENDPNSSTFQVNSGDGELTATLADGLGNTATTPAFQWSPAGEESPDPLFIVVENKGGFLTLNAYDDAGHTIHNGNSPVTVSTGTVQLDELAMDWIVAGANSKFTASTDPEAEAEIDNILIYSNPCPIARVDAIIRELFTVETLVDAKLTRQVKLTVDARLRGRKDFTVDAQLVRFKKFDVNAILETPVLFEFFVSGFLTDNFAVDFFVDAVIARSTVFTVSAIFSTEPADPDFSESHMLDIVPLFSGINLLEFTIDGKIAGVKLFTINARLTTPKTFTINASLSTEPQPLAFSTTHFQDITPLFGIDQPQLLPEVDALLKGFNFEEELIVDAKLVLKQGLTPEIDAQLSQVTKTVQPIVDSFLKQIDIGETSFVDARVVSRNITDTFTDAQLIKLGSEKTYIIDGRTKGIGLIQSVLFNARIVEKKEFTYIVDAILKLNGEDGFCNFRPDPVTIGTGLEQFVGPIRPALEENVSVLIGQEFNLTNQQIRSITLLIRANGFPFIITDDSFIQGKIWSNVVKGNTAGEAVVSTSQNTINANDSSGDLPSGVWTEVTFTFDPITSPFINGDILVGIEHLVGIGVNDPQGVGVAQPVISGGNVIAGEALFRRSSNSAFPDPEEWRLLIADTIDMVINLEVVNGNDIILGKGNQCPQVDAELQLQNIDKVFEIDGQLIPRNAKTFIVDTLLEEQDKEVIFIVDGILAGTESFEVDAQLFAVAPVDKTFVVDGNLLLTPLIPVQLDARLFNIGQNLKGFLVDAFFKKSDQTIVRFFDAQIQAVDQEEEFTVNATAIATFDEGFSVNAILTLLDQEETFTITGTLAITQPPVLFTVDAQMVLANNRFRIDAFVSQTVQFESQLDAILTEAVEEEFFVNAILKKFNIDKEFTVNSIIIQGNQKPFLVNVFLSVINSETTIVDGILSKDSITTDFTMNAILIKRDKFEVGASIQAKGATEFNGNNGSTNPLAVNPFVIQPNTVTGVPVPVGTNLCGQRLRLPTSPVRIIQFKFRLFRDGLSGSPTGTLQGRIYRNSISGNPVSGGDLLDTSDNIVSLSSLTTNVLGDFVVFDFSTVEITPDDNIFIGIQITGTNEEVFFNVENTGTVISGGDFTTESAGNWGADTGVDANFEITIDDEPRQRASVLINAIIGIVRKDFIVDGITKGGNIDKTFTISAKVVIPTSVEFTIGARLIGSSDVIIGAFVGEVQETVLDVESVVVTNNSDSGIESTLGGGEQ